MRVGRDLSRMPVTYNRNRPTRNHSSAIDTVVVIVADETVICAEGKRKEDNVAQLKFVLIQ
jgi:hypothetical protein